MRIQGPGIVPAAMILTIICFLVLPAVPQAQAGTNTWTGIGPAGGIIWAYTSSPANPSVLYVGAYSSGVYKSNDGGDTWAVTGIPDYQITSLAADPTDANIVYAANRWGGGVFKTTDGGTTWKTVNSGLGNRNVSALAADPSTPSTLYAGTNGGGIFKSTDAGANWNAINSGVSVLELYALAIDPKNPGTLYAGVTGDPYMLKTTNGGATWAASGQGISFAIPNVIVVDPTSSNTIYFAANGSASAYRSTNGGANWSLIVSGLPTGGSIWGYAMAIDPSNPGTVYLATAGSGLFKSTNRGDSWSAANNGIFNGDIRAVGVHPRNPGTVYVGTVGAGVFRSTNGGSSWSQTSLTATQVNRITIDPSTSSTMYVGTFWGGVFKTSNRGSSWSHSGLANLSIWGLLVDPRTPGTLYASATSFSPGAGIFKSTDSGATWKTANTGISETTIGTIAMDPSNNSTLYAGTNGTAAAVYKSTNGGGNWTPASTGLPKDNYVYSIAVDPSNPAIIYAGLNTALYKSTNGGGSWTELSNGLTNKKIRTVAIDPKNPATVYVGTSGGGVFKSTNGGDSWSSMGLSSSYLYVNFLLVDPKNPATVYVATGQGILRSTDGGATWNPIISGLPDKTVFCVAVDPQNTAALYAGTYYHGAFSYTTGGNAVSLYYPRLVTTTGTSTNPDNSEYTGIAVANMDSTDATLTFTAYDKSGALITGANITNPATQTLKAGAQLPIVDTQVWGSGLPAVKPVGWFKLDSTAAKIVGFFLMFNGNLSILDGADVSASKITSFILPEVEVQGFTQVHIANPNAEAAAVTIELVDASGNTRVSVSRNVNANGAVADVLTDLFPGAVPAASDYLRVSSTKGVVPFEYLGKSAQCVEGLNGMDTGSGATTLFSPQYVVGGADWSTTLSVVNLDSTAGTVSFRFIGDDGAPIGETRALPIAAKGKIYITDQTFFVNAGSTLTQGYVEIASSGPKLAGSLVFGDPGRNIFASALPLASTPRRDIIFSQVASNTIWFTGVALLNPNDSDAVATVQVFSDSGALVRTKAVTIPAKRRISKLLTQPEYFADLAGQNLSSGYIRVVADKGVAAFALFGTTNLTVLSAVPPQVIP